MKRLISAAAVIVCLATSVVFGAVTVDPPHFPDAARQNDPSAGASCATCHTGHLTLGSTGYNNICISCHRPGDPAGGTKPLTLADEANPFGTHSTAGISRMQQTSHRWSGSDTVPAAGALPPLQAALTSSGLRARTGGQLACVRCHNQHSNANGNFLRMANDRDQLCLDCHRTRNVTSHTRGSHPVNISYNAAAGSFNKPPVNPNLANPTSDLNASLTQTGGTLLCSTCHGVHFTDSKSSTVDGAAAFASLSSGDGNLLRIEPRGAAVAKGQTDNPNLCTSCHSGKKSHNFKNQDIQCIDCHGAHVEYDPQDPTASAGTNLHLIRRNVAKGATGSGRIFFRYTGSQREYKTADGTGVCQGCHAVTPAGTLNAPPEHASSDPKVCNTCHFHNNSNGSFSGACTECHGYPPVTGTIGGPDGLATPATNATQGSPGAHQAHVRSRVIGCNTCHNGFSAKPMPSNTIDINFAVNANNFPGFAGNGATLSSGTYTNTNTLTPGVSFSGAVATSGTNQACSNLYCHGVTLTAGTKTAPTWTGGAAEAACGTCHGASAASPPTTGSHLRHAGNGSTGRSLACASCHGPHPDKAHVNGSVSWDLSDLGQGAQYRGATGGATGNLAPSTSYGQCTNLYCHGDGNGGPPLQVPTWGGPSVASCLGCHGNDAASGTPIASGVHGAHINNTSTLGLGNNFMCGECHAATVSTSDNRTVVTQARHINAIKDYSGVRAGGSASYDASAKSCSASSCHSSGMRGIIPASLEPPAPSWSGGNLNCKGCHGARTAAEGAQYDSINGEPNYPNGGPGTPTANSHNHHVVSLGITDTTRCSNCHAKTVDPVIASKLKDYTAARYHLNRQRNVVFRPIDGHTGSFNADTTCSATYCHGTVSPRWGDAGSIRCDSCHGASNAPNHRLQGAHYIHYSSTAAPTNFLNLSGNVSSATAYRFTCSACHSPGPGHAIHADGPATPFGVAEVFFGMTSPGRNPQYNYSGATRGVDSASFTWTAGGSRSCNATYCHSNGNGTAGYTVVRWDSARSSSCTACHGDASTSGRQISSGAHQAHVNSAAAIGGSSFGCVECHALTVSDNTTISNKARHVNKQKDYSGARAGGSAGYNTTTKACSTSYCHSDGKGTPVPPPAWNSGQNLTCKGCHGGASSIAGEPQYANGGAGSATANSHQKHISARGISDTTGCAVCHRATVNVGTADKLATATTTHINRVSDINFVKFENSSGVYNPATKTCSSTYCHAAGTPQWGGAPLVCGQCHKANNTLAGGHSIHYASAVTPAKYLDYSGNVSSPTAYRFTCSSCHNSVHADGPHNLAAGQTADVQFAYTSAGRKGTYTPGAVISNDAGLTWTNGTCANTYCHSDGRGNNGNVTAFTWAPAGTLDCKGCHNFTPASGNPMASLSHGKHVSTYGIGCERCHYATTSTGSTITDKSRHINKQKEVSWNVAVDPGASFNAGGCDTVYCHSNGTRLTAPFTVNTRPVWGATLDCNGCHGLPGYTSGSPKANSHLAHNTNGYTCNLCHATVVNNSNTIIAPTLHTNGAYNVAAGGAVTFTLNNTPSPTTPAQCANISCHGPSPNSATWGTPIGCQGCHFGTADVDVFTAPFTTVPVINSSQWASSGHGRPAGAYSSGNPAANLAGANPCLYCHDSATGHNASGNYFRLRNSTDATWGRNGACMACHAPGSAGITVDGILRNGTRKVSSTHYGIRHTTIPGAAGKFCWDCHDAHGDGNIYMIHDAVYRTSDANGLPTGAANAVSFTAATTGSDYARSSAPFDGICNACHTVNQHYRTDFGDGHNATQRCTVCHSHSGSDANAAFKPNGDCNACHGYPPASPGFVGTQNNWSGARAENYAGGGGAHTISSHVSKTVKPSDGFAGCITCHRESDHLMSPTVFQPSSNIKVTINPRRAFLPATQVRYTSNRLDGTNHTTGGCLNVSCHFGATPKWDPAH